MSPCDTSRSAMGAPRWESRSESRSGIERQLTDQLTARTSRERGAWQSSLGSQPGRRQVCPGWPLAWQTNRASFPSHHLLTRVCFKPGETSVRPRYCKELKTPGNVPFVVDSKLVRNWFEFENFVRHSPQPVRRPVYPPGRRTVYTLNIINAVAYPHIPHQDR